RGVVLLAPPGRPFDAILREQSERESRRLALPPSLAASRRRRLMRWLAALRAGARPSTAAAAATVGLAAEGLADLVRVDPVTEVRRGKTPLLVCQGGKDIQVSLEHDALPLVHAASAAGRPIELRYFPLLDHLFKIEPGQSEPAHYFTRRPVGV